jgi:hypothetical protein
MRSRGGGGAPSLFCIAIGSALEVAGALDVMHHFGILSSSDRGVGHDLCDHLVAMLRRFR